MAAPQALLDFYAAECNAHKDDGSFWSADNKLAPGAEALVVSAYWASLPANSHYWYIDGDTRKVFRIWFGDDNRREAVVIQNGSVVLRFALPYSLDPQRFVTKVEAILRLARTVLK